MYIEKFKNLLEKWIKQSYFKQIYDNENQIVKNGRVYKGIFGVDMDSRKEYKQLTHVPTGYLMHPGIYFSTLKECQVLAEMFLNVDIDWDSSNEEVFKNIEKEKLNEITKILNKFRK